MDIGQTLWLLAAGVFGGMIAEYGLLTPYRRRVRREWPDFLRERTYWIMGIVRIVSGAVLVLLHDQSGSALTPLAATNLGFTGPLVFLGGAGMLPKPPYKAD